MHSLEIDANFIEDGKEKKNRVSFIFSSRTSQTKKSPDSYKAPGLKLWLVLYFGLKFD